jgi:4'-phosphopantetheinyl transferase
VTRTAGEDWFGRLGSAVHVWTVIVDGSPAASARCEAMLSEDEREHAEAFRFAPSRLTFVVARGCLRALLGRYLRVEPAAIRFDYGAQGKPSIAYPATTLAFNQSHSGDRAVFALVSSSQIGIDIEQITKLSDLNSIAERFFSPEEAADLRTISPSPSERAFFATWTRKEAFVKAVAQGLSLPLASFRVTVHPHQEARIVHVNGDAAAAQLWQMHGLGAGPSYAGAVVYEGQRRVLREFPLLGTAELFDLLQAGVFPGDLQGR